ncbi:tRNA (N(6)-L-threonylcarbamoyladenosine(37)-C(2))-methylthiotransferase MtaB [Helicobacter sp. 13S00401-1]|uniref:MiaB/RimO family radical SAM methylthiotransferase n=1 Tax=Helicobacter sp. 13S00401-1 TaxID=1905758 RepID=UPI000BA78327|nr:MiaB/RimO family radical SAM methylthiotransferase [Helicobacter sp. 13S00401-1]PAF48333.1 tRNA (N(6)-L-threonylcarbamoyladenosine(37)-C(2))-methylthiotransferase MtaB [Helicobacter sp. 13S00401-1]
MDDLSSQTRKKVFFKTFGCRSNIYDTQVMMSSLKNYDITQDESKADIIVLNSCTVTNRADKECKSYARTQSELGKKVLFTGCGVKMQGKELYDKNLTFSVFSHSYKEDIDSILAKDRIFLDTNSRKLDTTLLPAMIGKVKGFIKIQEGCNFKCSYCIIPYVRGVARSFKHDFLLEQASLLAKSGVKELVLTGTNIGSYGLDTGTHIATLISDLASIEGIKRIRLGSLEPSQIDSKFIDVLSNPKLERHLHIALQHTSEKMLRIMNRKNTVEHDLELFLELERLGFFLGTDYIVGHVGESKEIFNEALTNLEKLPLTHIHPFIYSPKTGTKSATNLASLELVPKIESKARLHLIQDLVREKNYQKRLALKEKSTPLNVLIESVKSTKEATGFQDASDFKEAIGFQEAIGFDEYFNKVVITSKDLSSSLKGSFLKVADYKVKPLCNLAL